MCLVPDLPAPEAILPFLQEMHQTRWYSNFGPLVQRFEAAMARFIAPDTDGVHVVSFSSATSALELMLRASTLQKGARILMPALTFPATALAAIREGFTPVFADVDQNNWALTPEIAKKCLSHTDFDAVMPVAPFGHPVAVAPWAQFQAEAGKRVFVDAAAALGQQPFHPDIPVCFSLHATKPFGVGEGGLLVTTDADLAHDARLMSNFGFVKGQVMLPGTKAKMGEYFAAMGLAQLARWQGVQARRREIYKCYRNAIAPLPAPHGFIDSPAESLPAVLTVHTRSRAAAVAQAMTANGIQTRRWYLPTLDQHPALKNCDTVAAGGMGALPVCEGLSESLIGLPFHSFLSDGDIHFISKILNECCN